MSECRVLFSRTRRYIVSFVFVAGGITSGSRGKKNKIEIKRMIYRSSIKLHPDLSKPFDSFEECFVCIWL